ncbi:hypothetical protein Back11_48240 [Paenibacillus baekrokdamisoli]|uniref:Uncharacterized protein n=1 Tax=Paenibacillus baekrokdamisoli TaxID=1712516 RepID=A0A3G9JKA2_9BACL|nr:hypothetical protein [Paenibacillus baekrokdamisoli]BBH23479.1 hypothetical protein Back11_48240 [Paenibacillus baekrokdamisoli]
MFRNKQPAIAPGSTANAEAAGIWGVNDGGGAVGPCEPCGPDGPDGPDGPGGLGGGGGMNPIRNVTPSCVGCNIICK